MFEGLCPSYTTNISRVLCPPVPRMSCVGVVVVAVVVVVVVALTVVTAAVALRLVEGCAFMVIT